MLWLYEKTGDKSLLDLCKLLYEQTFDWEQVYDEEAWLGTYHIVNAQQSFKLFPVMYAVTGDEHYLEVYYKGIENIYMASGRQDGMSNGDEMSRGIDALYGNETCAVVERMLCDEIALYLLRDATVADHLELILGWDAFSEDIYADIHLTLAKGTHILRSEKTEADVGFAELDAIDQIPCSLTGGVPAQDFKE